MNPGPSRSRTLSLLLAMLSLGCRVNLDSSPEYSFDQTDSAHAGHRRTTMTTEGAVYVHDFEEESLQLTNSDPVRAIGHTKFGGGKICAIEGQDPAAYVAADMGSEMPAYEVFRNVKQPPFDWRRTAFREMRLTVPTGPAANKETSDAALIAEVVATLRDDSAAAPPLTVATPLSENPVHALLLFSEQLPGMAFSPWVYFDTAGPVYLAESFDSITFHGTDQTIHASWIPARASFSQWSKTADAPSAQPR